MDKRKNNGGARKGAGRKKGIGLTSEILGKHCYNFMVELLKDDAIKTKAIKQLSLFNNEVKDEDYLYID